MNIVPRPIENLRRRQQRFADPALLTSTFWGFGRVQVGEPVNLLVLGDFRTDCLTPLVVVDCAKSAVVDHPLPRRRCQLINTEPYPTQQNKYDKAEPKTAGCTSMQPPDDEAKRK